MSPDIAEHSPADRHGIEMTDRTGCDKSHLFAEHFEDIE
jgi:hypothetical protein